MHPVKTSFLLLNLLFGGLLFVGCKNASEAPKAKEIVFDPELMDERAAEYIESSLDYAKENNGKIDDSISLHLLPVVKEYYNSKTYVRGWSSKEKWHPLADSLYLFIKAAENEGLFPEDYHFAQLRSVKWKLDNDSLQRMDAALWARADLMLTDGFMRIVKDLKQGRLQADSLALHNDPAYGTGYFLKQLAELQASQSLSKVLNALQPAHAGYWELKAGLRSFTDSMDRRKYTYVRFPFRKGDAKDSLMFISTIQQRLKEANVLLHTGKMVDSLGLATAIKKYQLSNGLVADGKIGPALVKKMNINDAEQFKRIAVTLDRYKQLPERMPEKFIWVNLPGYYLQVWERDSMVMESRVIIGKPHTRTPVLSADISDLITYPTWTVPNSIIVKEILPGLKRDAGYLSRKGLSLFDNKGEMIEPSTVNWAKYSKGIPYKVQQGSGDGNALGVIKFNFNNPYAVYLHDTNQRYLFKNAARALSHGCVRVQDWQKLAFYIARNDSLNIRTGDSLRYNTDSILTWIAKKQRHRIIVKNKMPLFIRYFGCESKNGKIRFYDDVYGDDKRLRDKYFVAR